MSYIGQMISRLNIYAGNGLPMYSIYNRLYEEDISQLKVVINETIHMYHVLNHFIGS